ncbi:S-layer homology domain-containing protein [Cohnella laeviribosi]|uniref:S-layer homology domain-containing protein n=1 Tax=Cohnella laeviribosi TaxID=380174 RepID=UPI003D1E8895
MKKSLSLLLAIALVFGLFASMASAAENDLTTAQKYQQLKDKGILKGTTTGSDMLDDNLTRAQFATIAVAVLGLSEDNSAPSPFSDIKAGQWWYGAIKAASTAGLVNGIGNGKFGPKQTVTLQEVYKVAASALKLAPVTDAKVDGAAAWAAPYIQALIDAGFKLPSTNYKANATRGQTIEVAYDLYLAGQVQPLSDVSAVVNADDTITVTGKTAGGVDSVKVAIGTAAEAAATLNADGSFTYTSAAQAVGTYTVKVVAYKGTAVAASTEKSVEVAGFKVESATVLNGKQIAIKFNKAVQAGTAAGGHNNLGYYSLSGNSSGSAPVLRSASLSDDKTTVTLTFNRFKENGGLDRYAQLTVSDSLKSASGKSLTAYKEPILLTDTTSPSVTGVEYAGTTATIKFSEPVKSVGTLTLGGATLSSSASTGVYYSLVTDGTTEADATAIKIYNLTTNTNYSFYLIGGQDTADNLFDYNTTLNVPSDTVAPSITSLTVNGGVLTAKFSEAISNAGNVYWNGNTVSGTISSDDNTVATYNVGSWLGSSTTFLNITVKVSGYKDLVGNTGSDFTQAVTISKDTTAPTVVSALYDGNYVAIKFSEALDTTGTVANTTYTYTDSSSVVYQNRSLTGGSFKYDANNDGDTSDSGEDAWIKYAVSGLGTGKYEVSIPAGLVKDAAGNLVAKTSVTFNVTAGATSGSVIVNSIEQTANGQLTFKFNANLTTAALDASKYLINGVALPSGTNIYFLGDKKTVVADLPEGAIAASGTRLIKVVNIVDENGNTLNTSNSAYYQASINLTENTKPVAQSLALVSDSALAVTLSETINALPTTGVEIYINGTKYTGAQSYSKSDNVLNITVAAGTFSATQTIEVKFNGSDLTDLNGNKVKDGSVTK